MAGELTYADVRGAAQEALDGVHAAMRDLSHAIGDLRGAIQGVKHDTSQISDIGSHTLYASLQRLEANMNQLQNMASTVNHLLQSHGEMHQRIQNIEQLAGDMGSYLTNLQTQVTHIIDRLGPAAEQED